MPSTMHHCPRAQVRRIQDEYNSLSRSLKKYEGIVASTSDSSENVTMGLTKIGNGLNHILSKIENLEAQHAGHPRLSNYRAFESLKVDVPYQLAKVQELKAVEIEKEYKTTQTNAEVVEISNKTLPLFLEAGRIHHRIADGVRASEKQALIREEGVSAANALITLHNMFLHISPKDTGSKNDALRKVISVFSMHHEAIHQLPHQDLNHLYMPTQLGNVVGHGFHTWGNILADVVFDAIRDTNVLPRPQKKIMLSQLLPLVNYPISDQRVGNLNVSHEPDRVMQAEIRADIEQEIQSLNISPDRLPPKKRKFDHVA